MLTIRTSKCNTKKLDGRQTFPYRVREGLLVTQKLVMARRGVLFRHSGNVLVFGDETRMNHLVENRQPYSGRLSSASISLPKPGSGSDPSRFHDQG
jgi:hypothetical protein